jgi:acetyl-CoA carboxylase carboxyl transferase subunit alpha
MTEILAHEREIEEYRKTIDRLKKQSHHHPLFSQEITRLEQKLEELKATVYKSLSPWERVQISRHPSRPKALDFIKNITDSFVELCGDRTFGDDQALVGGLAKINGVPLVIMGQEKGKDTEGRIRHNFGMMNPEGFRKALRLMKLAEKFSLPVLTLLDTSGANPILEAEERGQGWAIALNLREMARLKTPIIVVVIGEGCSGGALGIGVGDVIGMLEHAYYSVISPEGCASILWKDSSKKVEASEALKLTAEDLLRLQIIDKIIPEPLGGAHHDPKVAYDGVKNFFLEEWGTLRLLPKEILLEERYLKFRKIGG